MSNNETTNLRLLCFIFVGPPGAGKTTQAKKLSERYKLCHISIGVCLVYVIQVNTFHQTKSSLFVLFEGDLLRNYSSSINQYNRSNTSSRPKIPEEVTFKLIKKSISESICDNGFILDGFPRILSHAQKLDEFLKEKNKKIDAVFEFQIDDDLLIRRILGRLIHKRSGRSYHEIYNPPKIPMTDDVTGEPLERRLYDRADVLQSRLDYFHNETKPLLKYYNENGVKCVNIDASLPLEDVTQNFIKIFDDLKKKSTSNSQITMQFSKFFDLIKRNFAEIRKTGSM